MLLQGYFDDSGSHGGDGLYVLGGFLAPDVSWARFSAEWQQALAKEPAIDYFKMSEAISLRGQFARWPAALRDQKVFELAEVAEKHAVARISAMVYKQDFDAHIKGASPWRELDSPYFLLYNQVVVLTVNFIGELGKRSLDISGATVEFIFDDQGLLGEDAVSWWEVLKQALAPEQVQLLVQQPSFGSDKRQLPLQAADLLAWSVRHVAEGGEASVLTGAVVQRLKRVPPYGGFVSADQMRDSLPELAAVSEPYWPR
ncbi:DUF3800 domain-containing protein [Mesorhizobium sp. M0092]|uniref:DUF3800 domain-containing protein n=1 Tax=Mesorhizobium sp. M0092 TaxID=2956876 RepID=UPI003339501C